MHRRKTTAVAACLLLATACGPTGATTTVAEAAERVAAQGTAKVSLEMAMTMPGDAGGGEVTVSGEGALDYENHRGSLSMSFSGDGPARQMTGMMGEIETIYDGLVVYMRWPMLTQMLPGGARWVRMDLAAAGEEFGIDMQQFMQFGQSDPFQGVEYLRGADDVEELGTEEVRGVETTRYRASIDFDKLVDEIEDAGMARLIDQTREISGIERIASEVWIDGDGLVRRVRYDFADLIAAETEGQDASLVMQMELYDFGTEVEIDLPPEDDVTDLLDLMQREQARG